MAFALAAALVLVAALAVRLLYMDATPTDRLVHDGFDYDAHATSLALGGGYSERVAWGRPTAFRPPGYPYFLAGVYRLAGVERAPDAERIEAARIAGALVGTLIVALLGVLAAQLFNRRVALIAMALAAVYLPLVLVGASVMSEPLFAALLLAALVVALQHRRSAHRRRWAVGAGVLAGLAILTRANAAVLLVPLAIAVWDARPRFGARALGPPAALLAAALLTVLPWTIRNANELGTFVPVSTQLGSALAGTYNDQARADERNPASWRSVKHVPDYADLWAARRTTPEPVLERRLRERALAYAADHPLYVAEVGFWNTVRMLDLAGPQRSRATAATIAVPARWADRAVVCFWIFAALALAGAFTAAARRAPLLVWALPVLMFAGLIFIVVETPRYRTGIDPFVVLLAALAVSSLRRRTAGQRNSAE